MLLKYLILYYLYILIYHLCYKLTVYAKMLYLISDTIKILTIINAYELYIDYIYNDLNLKKNICLLFELNNNRKFVAKINNIYKINCDIVIFTSRSNFSPLYSDIKNITVNPNKKSKINLFLILNKTFPREIINYIGNYVCDCKLCSNVMYSI